MVTEEEKAALLQRYRERQANTPGITAGKIQDTYEQGLRSIDRGVRVGIGLPLGTAYAAVGAPIRAVTPEGMWLRPGDITESFDAFKAFNEQRKKGDWDAGIAAYQDEMDAGTGAWALSELIGEVLLPGGLAKAGTRVLKAADKFGDFAPAARAFGQGLRLPWEAEEAAGRAMVAPFRPAARALARRLRPSRDGTKLDPSAPDAIPAVSDESEFGPIDEYLNQPTPDAPTARPMPGATATDTKYQDTVYNPDGSDAGWTIESVVDDMVASTDQSATPTQLQFASNNPKNMEAEFNLRLSEEGASPERVTFAAPTPGAAEVYKAGEVVYIPELSVRGLPSSPYKIREVLAESRTARGNEYALDNKSKSGSILLQPAFLRPNGTVGLRRQGSGRGGQREPLDDYLVNPSDIGRTPYRDAAPVTPTPGAAAGLVDDVPLSQAAMDGADEAAGVGAAGATPQPGVVWTKEQLTLPKNLGVPQPRWSAHPLTFQSGVDTVLYSLSKAPEKWTVKDKTRLEWLQRTLGASREEILTEARRVRADIQQKVAQYPSRDSTRITVAPSKWQAGTPSGAPRVGAPTPSAAPVTGARAATDVRQPSLGKTDTTINGETTTTYSVNGQTVNKTAYDAAEATVRAANGGAGGGRGAPPGGRPDDMYPDESMFDGQSSSTPKMENDGPLKQLQNIGPAIRRATTGGRGRQLANSAILRPLFKRINPDAVANNASAKAMAGRHILLEEGKQKADIAFTSLSRLGTQTKVFGEAGPDGLLLNGPYRTVSLNDIRSNPGKYPLLSNPQKEWIEAADALEKSKLSLLKMNGIEVDEITLAPGMRYAGRRAYGKLNTDTGQIEDMKYYDSKGNTIKQGLSSDNERKFATVKEANAEGWVYIPEDEALLFNIRDTYRRVADKKYSDYALENIRGLQLAGRVNADGTINVKPDGAVDVDDGIMGLKGAYFTGPEANELAAQFNRELTLLIRPPASGLQTAIAKANALGRFMTLNGDAGQFSIQLLFLANFRPLIWGKSILAFTETLFSTRYHTANVANNSDLLARHPNLITSINGTEMTEALDKGGFLSKGGIIGKGIRAGLDPFGRAFGSAMDDAGINLAKSLESKALLPNKGPYNLAERTKLGLPALTRADFDEVIMADIDDFINEMRGLANSARIGTTSSQQMIETMGLLAPRYNRAIAALLYDAGRGVAELAPGVDSTIRGDLAREALTRSVLGLTGIASAISLASYVMKQQEANKELNWDDAMAEVTMHINPSSPRFFTWDMNGVNIGPGTKVRTLINFAAKTTGAANTAASGDIDTGRDEFMQTARSFARGQASPVIGAGWNALTGFGYMGEPTPLGVGSMGNNEYWDGYNEQAMGEKVVQAMGNQLLPHIIPVWIQGMAMSGDTSIGNALKMGGGEFLGLRTSPQNRNQISVEIAREQGIASNQEEYDKLPGVQKAMIEALVEEEHGRRDYRGAQGKLYEKKDKENDKYIRDLNKMVVNVDKGAIGKPGENGVTINANLNDKGFDPSVARRRFIELRNIHNEKMVGINEDLYGKDAQVEPEVDTRAYDLWSYYNIYEGIEELDLSDDEKFEIIAEEEGKFWSQLNTQATLDGDELSGRDRVDYVLNSIRLIENRYPAAIKRMVQAMRYSSSVEQDILGTRTTYWDLNQHPRFIQEMEYLTGASEPVIRAFLDRPYRAQRAISDTSPDGIEAFIFKASENSKKKGVLNTLRNEFIKQAPDEWQYSMLFSGYSYTNSTNTLKALRAQMANGASTPSMDFAQLYEDSLLLNNS